MAARCRRARICAGSEALQLQRAKPSQLVLKDWVTDTNEKSWACRTAGPGLRRTRRCCWALPLRRRRAGLESAPALPVTGDLAIIAVRRLRAASVSGPLQGSIQLAF